MESFEHQPRHDPSSFEARLEQNSFETELWLHHALDNDLLNSVGLSPAELSLGESIVAQLRKDSPEAAFDDDQREADIAAAQKAMRFVKLSHQAVLEKNIDLFVTSETETKKEAGSFAETLHDCRSQFANDFEASQRLVERFRIPLDTTDTHADFIEAASQMAFVAANINLELKSIEQGALSSQHSESNYQREQEIAELEELFKLPAAGPETQ